MATKSTRYLDNQGRVIIPSHIRKALNLGPNNVVSVELDDNNCIRIRATDERCSLCGESVSGKGHTTIKAGAGEKFICYNCAQAVARAMLK